MLQVNAAGCGRGQAASRCERARAASLVSVSAQLRAPLAASARGVFQTAAARAHAVCGRLALGSRALACQARWPQRMPPPQAPRSQAQSGSGPRAFFSPASAVSVGCWQRCRRLRLLARRARWEMKAKPGRPCARGVIAPGAPGCSVNAADALARAAEAKTRLPEPPKSSRIAMPEALGARCAAEGKSSQAKAPAHAACGRYLAWSGVVCTPDREKRPGRGTRRPPPLGPQR